MCVTLITIYYVNPGLAGKIKVIPSRAIQLLIGCAGTLFLIAFLFIHISKDIQNEVAAWYFHSTPIWLIVMGIGTIVFLYKIRRMKQLGIDTKAIFHNLPKE